MRYRGPPNFADVPLPGSVLTEEQLQDGRVVEADEYPVDEQDDDALAVGFARPEWNDAFPPQCESGTEGLKPFPGCQGPKHDKPEDYPERYPNPEVTQRGGRVFTQWGARDAGTAGNELAVATPPRWKAFRLAKSPVVPGGGSCLWQVDLWAYELVRTIAAGAGPVVPSQDDFLDSGGASANVRPGSQFSKLKMRLMWAAASGGTTRVVDIGEGIRMAVEASLLTVELLYPDPGTVQVAQTDQQGAEPQLALLGGTVLDTIFGACIVPTTSTPGQQLATNTITVEVLAGVADVPVFVPPGTRAVSIYQGPLGALATPTWRHARSAAAPGPVIAPITIGATRRAERVPRPGISGLITTGAADGGADRLLTFVFELEI